MRERPKFDGRTLKRLLSYMRAYKGTLVLVTVCILLSAVAGAASSMFLQKLIDGYIVPMLGTASPDFSGLIRALITIGCVYLVGTLATWLYNRRMVTIAQGTLKRIRDEMFEKMQRLPIRYFDTHTHGDIMSLYTNDTDTLRQMISQSLPNLLMTVIVIATVFFIMLYYSVWMCLVIIAGVAFMTFMTKLLGSNSARFFIAQQTELGVVEGHIEEVMNGQKVVKAFCHESAAEADFDERNEKLFEVSQKANMYANILMPIMNNLGYVQYVLIAMLGGWMAFSGFSSLTLGAIASFLQLSRSFTMPVSQISQQASAIVMALAGAERIFQLLDETPETDEGYVTLVNAEEKDGQLVEVPRRTDLWAWKHPHSDGTVTYTKMEGDVRFYDVDFGYVPEKIVLHDVSLYAKPGQKIAFVGSTGAGKTTVTNLLNRFYDISEGEILIDGIDVKKYKREYLRENIAMVLQDTHLFTGTVRENIRYGRLDATDDEVVEAAKTASAHSFIMRLEHGYDTILEGDGANLSQGQRQLLNIARAALSKAPILVMDEATSSVDTRTERHIEHGMTRLMKDRTTFVIAHRLSTVRNANAIMVLENGEIIERGDHDDLLKQNGRYYELYTGKKELD